MPAKFRYIAMTPTPPRRTWPIGLVGLQRRAQLPLPAEEGHERDEREDRPEGDDLACRIGRAERLDQRPHEREDQSRGDLEDDAGERGWTGRHGLPNERPCARQGKSGKSPEAWGDRPWRLSRATCPAVQGKLADMLRRPTARTAPSSSYSAACFIDASWIARQTTSGVAGMSSFVMPDAPAQRVDDGVHHRRAGADRAGLAGALDAERIALARHIARLEMEERHVVGARHGIVGERRRDQLAVVANRRCAPAAPGRCPARCRHEPGPRAACGFTTTPKSSTIV